MSDSAGSIPSRSTSCRNTIKLTTNSAAFWLSVPLPGKILAKIGHTEEIRQLKQARVALRFSHGNFATVHLRERIRTNEARIALHEINTERQGQDRDHDHEPVAMLTENLDHVRSGQFTSEPNRANYFLRWIGFSEDDVKFAVAPRRIISAS